MPDFGEDENPELLSLRRAKQSLLDQIDSHNNDSILVKRELVDVKFELTDALNKAQQEQVRAIKAEDALSQKTKAFNILRDQRANMETSMAEMERTIKEQKSQISKLELQVEVVSVRTADAATAALTEEKAALTKRVHQLSTELQRTQMDLDKQKESVKAPSAPTSVSKIARPPSRSSIVSPDSQPSSQGRFGFRPTPAPSTGLPKSIRPPSSLGSNAVSATPARPPSRSGSSSIPSLKGPAARRPSVTSATPTAVNTSSSVASLQKISQLEADLSDTKSSVRTLESSLADAESSISTLQASLAQSQTKLHTKSDDLLRVENQLMALDRTSKDQLGQVTSELEDARDEAEGAKEEAREVRDELRREMDALAKDAREERKALEERIERLKADLARSGDAREEAEGTREELERLLQEAREEADDLREEKEETELELAHLEEELMEMEERLAVETAEKEKLEEELAGADDALGEIEADNISLSARLDQMEKERGDLVERLALAESAPSPTTREVVDPSVASEQSEEVHTLRGQLSELEEQIVVLSAERDAQASTASQTRLDLQAASARIEELSAASEATRSELDGKQAELVVVRQEFGVAVSALDSLRSVSSSVADEFASRISSFELQLALANDDIAAKIAQLDAHAEAAASRQAADDDTDSLRSRLVEKDEEIARLQATIDEYEQHASTSVGSDEVEELKNSLALAEEEVQQLQERLKEVESLEWGSADAVKVAEEEIATLQARVVSLEASLEAEKGLATEAKSATTAVEVTLAAVRQELATTNDQLGVESRGRQDSDHERDCLLAEIDELELSHARFEQIEDQLAAVNVELDGVRAAAEDASFSALQEVNDLQTRLREQESYVDTLERRVVEADAMRRMFSETESRLDSLGGELSEARAVALDKEKENGDKMKVVLQRAETAEAAAVRLRTDLDELKHRLSDAQDQLDQAHADLAVSTASTPLPASPSPASPTPSTPSFSRSFAFSPESDPTVLIIRLREERDELRQRLDYARAESRFRTEDLQSRLHLVEESKAKELSTLEMNLLDKQAAFETECETNAKMEQALREAKREKERVDEELESSAKKLKEAESKVEEAMRKLAEEQKMREEQQAEKEDAWTLEADSTRAEIGTAVAANEELRLALSSLQSDLTLALEDVGTHQLAAEAAGARIAELEDALAASKDQGLEAEEQGHALAQFASLCDALRFDVDGLHAKIAQQDSTIDHYQRRIALLQLNLAMRVAIEDDEDPENVSAPVEAVVETSLDMVPLGDLLALEQQLDEARSEHTLLQQQLSALEAHLDSTVTSAEAQHDLLRNEAATHASRVVDLETAHEDATSRLALLQDQLVCVEEEKERLSVSLNEALTSSSTHLDDLNSVRQLLEDAESRATEHEEQLVKATTELAGAQQAALELREKYESGQSTRAVEGAGAEQVKQALSERVQEVRPPLPFSPHPLRSRNSTPPLVSALDGAQLALSASQNEVSSLISRLTAATDDLAATKDILAITTTSLAAAQTQAESADDRHTREQHIVALEAQVQQLQIDVDERSIVLEQSQHRVALLEEQLAATTSDRDAAVEALSANEDQENRLLDLTAARDQAASDLAATRAEAASFASEVHSLRQSMEQVPSLEALVEDAQREVVRLAALVETEHAEAAMAKSAVDEATSKAQATAELSAREIQTLRKLSKASQNEAESLTTEMTGLKQKVEELTSHIDEITASSHLQLQQLKDESTKNIEEVIAYLQNVEAEKIAVEEQVRVLEQQVKDLAESASASQSNGEAEARVAELEKLLEDKMVDVEEADEKLIEALKTQKRYTSSIERLKAKIASLQRDLTAAKTAPAGIPVFSVALPTAPAAPSSHKKRRAPQDFDPSPVAVPRAIVASSVPAALDQENLQSDGAQRIPRSRSPAKLSTRVDGVVPLKPAHNVIFTAPVKPLQPLDENAPSVVLGAPVAAKAPASNVDSLKARMKAQRKERAAASAV